MIQSITILGAGNVGLHLGKRLNAIGVRKLNIYARSYYDEFSAPELKSVITLDKAVFDQKVDMMIIAIPDDHIQAVAKQIPDQGQLVVHTSGSTAMKVLDKFQRYGVLYPLQTFSKHRALDWDNIPLFLEGSDNQTQQVLLEFAGNISRHCRTIDSAERKRLHISAVFVSNFVNHMIALGKDIADEQNVDFALFYPLIKETIAKIMAGDPAKAQTGPAIRNDQLTIEKHLQALNDHEMIRELYAIISQSIYRKSTDDQPGHDLPEAEHTGG